MAGTLRSRKDIPEPPSIAVISPLGWAAVATELVARSGVLVDDKRDTAENACAVEVEKVRSGHGLQRMRAMLHSLLTFRIRSASAGGMTSAA